MPAKNKPAVTTPLQLLEQLSSDLLRHFEKACDKALDEAEGLLAKLEKERARSQDKLQKAQEKRVAALEAGKPKAQAKAESRIAELESLLAQLQMRQQQLLGYLAQLRRDTDRSLQLAKGIQEVEVAARAASEQGEIEATQVKKSPRRLATPAARPAAASNARAARPRKAAAEATPAPVAEPASKPKPARPTRKPAASAPRRSPSRKQPTPQPAE